MSNLKSTRQCYHDMKQRCLNVKSAQYKNYGARGIKICERWLSGFDLFLEDMGVKPNGMTLDRIDNDGIYEPSNCRWATRREQRLNQRNCSYIEHQGKKLTVEDWSREIGVHVETLRTRIRLNYPIELVLSKGSLRCGGVSPTAMEPKP